MLDLMAEDKAQVIISQRYVRKINRRPKDPGNIWFLYIRGDFHDVLAAEAGGEFFYPLILYGYIVSPYTVGAQFDNDIPQDEPNSSASPDNKQDYTYTDIECGDIKLQGTLNSREQVSGRYYNCRFQINRCEQADKPQNGDEQENGSAIPCEKTGLAPQQKNKHQRQVVEDDRATYGIGTDHILLQFPFALFQHVLQFIDQFRADAVTLDKRGK